MPISFMHKAVTLHYAPFKVRPYCIDGVFLQISAAADALHMQQGKGGRGDVTFPLENSVAESSMSTIFNRLSCLCPFYLIFLEGEL